MTGNASAADVIVVGGGPAGYTAALYCARAGLSVLVLERLSAGGQMAASAGIENYPGFDEAIDGFSLGERMQRQAERFGARTTLCEVTGAKLDASTKTLVTSEGDMTAPCVILATGAYPRKLDLPGGKRFDGRSVHYCASCDGMAYRGKRVSIVGGGDAAVADALVLSRICEHVTLIHRRDRLRAAQAEQKPLLAAGNVALCMSSAVVALEGEERLSGVRVRNTETGEEREIACDGLFVSIGRVPDTAPFAGGALELDASGYIVADETARTSLPGVFAAGDVRTKEVRQIVTAVADGAVAARRAEEYIARNERVK